MFYRTPSWLHGAALDRSQRGRWMLVCRVWNPTGRLTQKRQIAGWRKSAGHTRMPTFIPFSAHECLKNVFLCVFLPLFISYLSTFFFTPPLTPSLSLSHLSTSSQFLSRSNSMCTPGCRGNRRRPHKLVGEQKTQRPLIRRGMENQISFFFQRGGGERGGGAECAERGEKYEEVVEGDGWMDGVGEMSS